MFPKNKNILFDKVYIKYSRIITYPYNLSAFFCLLVQTLMPHILTCNLSKHMQPKNTNISLTWLSVKIGKAH